MAKCVGYIAEAAGLILSGALEDLRGLLLPTSPRVYEPVLAAMHEAGIGFHETCTSDQANEIAP